MNMILKHLVSGAYNLNRLTIDYKEERWMQYKVLEDLTLNFSSFGRVKVPSKKVKFDNGNSVNLSERFKRLMPSLIYYPRLNQQLIELTLGSNLPFIVKKYVYHLFVEPIDLNDESVIVLNKDLNPFNNHAENLKMLNVEIEHVSSIHQLKDIIQPISQYDIFGDKITTYQSIQIAEEITGIDKMKILFAACKLNEAVAENYLWKFGTSNSYNPKPNINQHKIILPKIQQYNSNGELLAEYLNSVDASIRTGISQPVISCALNKKQHTAGGYIWKLKNDNLNIF